MHRGQARPPKEADPGRLIADPAARELYYTFLDAVCDMHDEMRLETTRFESRIFFRDEYVCRVVPYRELFHVQIGKRSVWETRVRDAAGCLDTLHRVLAKFLEIYASPAGRGRKSSRPGADGQRRGDPPIL